jgi:hypothetical protein
MASLSDNQALRVRLAVLELIVNHLLEESPNSSALRESISKMLKSLESDMQSESGISLMHQVPELWLFTKENELPAEIKKPHLKLVD